MKRRDFLKKSAVVGVSAPFVLNELNINTYASPVFDNLAKIAAESDKIIVIIQLNGGNDGLNTVVPLDMYSNLSKARQNILIDETKVLKLTNNTGLNPALTGLQNLYKDGKLGIIQSVGYPNPNLSHFRATDIWTSASDSDKQVSSGWLGRYLSDIYPDYPTNYPNTNSPDPLSVTIGSIVSNTCQGPVYSMGTALSGVGTNDFYNITAKGEDTLPDSIYGSELGFVRETIGKTQLYTNTLKNAANKGKSLSTKYPPDKENRLADQLKIIAQLISGGLKTKIFVANLNGFDTHSYQNQADGDYLGSHSSLLGFLSEAISAFQDDLKLIGAEDRVVGLTFSEFGRRIKSNLSLGTDHGTAAPMMVFGTNVNPIIHGTSPIISSNVSVNDNLPMQFDFRSVYSSILKDWLGVSDTNLKNILFNNFQYLPIIKTKINSVETEFENAGMLSNQPNPVGYETNIKFKSLGGLTQLSLFDNSGNRVAILSNKDLQEGEYSFNYIPNNLSAGNYFLRLETGSRSILRPMQVIK